jgi:CubicO group peptidase (beta-lactamase class C family)
MTISRRKVLAGAGAFAMTTPVGAASSWTTTTPEAAGFVPDLADRLDYGIRSGLLRDLHGIVVTRHGKLVVEKYYAGADENWGRKLGTINFSPETLHDLRSVTKSIVSLLYGIALSRGLVPALDAPLLASFPAYADLAKDPARAAWKVQHAFDMSLGTEWNENLPYTNPANSEIQMEMAADPLRFVLDRPINNPAGTKWTYNGGCTALIGHLIAKGTGKKLPDFAGDVLFAPLGITNFEWAEGNGGVASAASGLRLTPRDLARIGQLVLDKGMANGTQIVPAAWIDAMHKPALPTGDGLQYSRFWFVGDAAWVQDIAPWIAGFGNGGQRLWISPSTGITVASFSGAYNRPDNWITPARIWREIVLGNLVKP